MYINQGGNDFLLFHECLCQKSNFSYQFLWFYDRISIDFAYLSHIWLCVLSSSARIGRKLLRVMKTDLSLQQKQQRQPACRSENNKNKKTKKYTIMKTMNVTPMTVAQYESSATVVKMMKAVKKGLASTVKFLMFISPVYPQCTQGMR